MDRRYFNPKKYYVHTHFYWVQAYLPSQSKHTQKFASALAHFYQANSVLANV